jgi:hypothetical protein
MLADFLLAENCVDSGSGLGGRDGSVLNGHGGTPAKMAEGDSLFRTTVYNIKFRID